MKKKTFLLMLVCCMQWLCVPAAGLKGLKVEYAVSPLGIDTPRPRFSWQMTAGELEYGVRQKAYRLWVYGEDGSCLWDSGKVTGDNSLNIAYAGQPLEPETRYQWKLSVWTQKNKEISASSWFETGLMEQNDKGARWNGAKWIGGGNGDLVLYSHYLPEFKLNYEFRLDSLSGAPATAFVYGANDIRLMDANKNLYGISCKKNESYIKIELDASALQSGKEAEIKVYRVGYSPDDKPGTPLATLKVPLPVLGKANIYGKHTLTLTSDMGVTTFFLDGMANVVGEVNMNPIGRGGDYITFPVLADVGFCRQSNGKYPDAAIEIRNIRSPENILATIYPPKDDNADKGSAIYITNPSRNAAPMLRTVFQTRGKKIARARLYVTARGIYDFYINGRRVGNDYFNPGETQYNKTHFYQAFDVTSYLQSGRNAAGAVLSEGWWSGAITYTGRHWNYFGDRQSLLAKLAITYEDGETEYVVTSPATWKFFNNGPVVYGSFFQGEVYDARREKAVEGWSTAAYDDSAWKAACEVPLEGNISLESGEANPRVDDYSQYNLTGQLCEPVRQVKELTAQSVEEIRPGVYVYDMGQNMAGVPCIKLEGCKPGQHVYLRFAEVKYPALPAYAGHEGMIMLENIRGAMAQDIYIARGGSETITPRFTLHGYRFIEITGIDRPLPLEAVKGTVLSSVGKLASYYETSNPKVNRLWENIIWSSYANLLSIPTDCPQRNERMGWAGDISVFSRTSTYLTRGPQFLRNYLRAMRDVQRADGRFADVAPIGGGFGGMLWGSAGITIPWECYLQYRDIALLEEHYPAMKNYTQYLVDKCVNKETGIFDQGPAWPGNLGDWLAPENLKNDATLLWDAYFIYDLDIMRQVAGILGHKDDSVRYAGLRDERVSFFNRTYIDPATGKTRFAGQDKLVDTQTSYLLPLAFGIVPDDMRSKVAGCLVNTIQRANTSDDGKQCPPYSLMTGFIGTAWISRVLSDCGYKDVAYRLLQQTSYPSWLYSVEQGATTIWERLNSYTHTDGFGGNNQMNSFNHYSFGSVGAWMYNCSLGIQPDTLNPGFKHFFLKPEFDPTGAMKYARGYYDSMYGRIASGWEVTPGSVKYMFHVPANTSATVCLPAEGFGRVAMNSLSLKEGKDYIIEDGILKMELDQGRYSIEMFRK